MNSQTINNATCIKTRNSSGDEIASVNFVTDDIVHALQTAPILAGNYREFVGISTQLN